jgi:hypothetical protein
MTIHNEDEVIGHLQAAGQRQQDTQRAAADIEKVRAVLGDRFAREASAQSKTRSWPLWTKLLSAAAVLIAGVGAVVYFGGLPDGSSVAWADVVERFKSVDFFNATIYFKDNASSEPRQVEIWMGRGGEARLRAGSQVLFARDGRVSRGFDFVRRITIPQDGFDSRAGQILEMLGRSRPFNLDTVLQMVCHDKPLQEVTPTVNADAGISADLVVFDLQSVVSPEWLRIWALAESRLPVRLLSWDPRNGGCVDVVFTYSKEQPADFFDPNAYTQVLSSQASGGSANLAYALLKDPGGRDYVPQDLFAKAGYHMPVVEQVGITEYGAVWVVAGRSGNHRPDGGFFFGFLKTGDDLGREYNVVWSTHRVSDDRSIQVFLPEGYPFDRRMPGKLFFMCQAEVYRPNEKPDIIGTTNLTQWDSNTPWPAEMLSQTEAATMLRKAQALCLNKSFELCDQVVGLARTLDKEGRLALEIERLDFTRLLVTKDFQKAAEIALERWPAAMDRYLHPGKEWPSPWEFMDYLVAVAGAGRIDKAAELWQAVRQAKPDLSAFPRPARIAEQLAKELTDGSVVRTLVIRFRDHNLDIGQMEQILGIDIRHNKELAPLAGYRPEVEDWQRHREELARYYLEHPLKDGQADLRPHRPGEQYPFCDNLNLPGLDGYMAWPVSGSLRDNHFRLYKGPENAARILLDTGLQDMDLNHDLVSRNTDFGRSRELLIGCLGLEVVEDTRPVKVWIAIHDGRSLKDPNQVLAPLRYDSLAPKAGMMRASARAGLPLSYLFINLAMDQGVFMDNQTRLDPEIPVALECPSFAGPEGKAFACQWFKNQFGITFTEEIRPMTVWVVRKKTSVSP